MLCIHEQNLRTRPQDIWYGPPLAPQNHDGMMILYKIGRIES